jgi:transposase
MPHVTVMTGPERRRRWSDEERLRILEAACTPGAVVAEVARRYDVCTSLIYKWRRAAQAESPAAFMPVMLSVPEVEWPRSPGPEPAMVVEFSGGARVTVGAHAPAALVSAALKALR